ncbi:MAG: hypothetical protein HDKAJFGB_00617 [Anaerolineae bacterium]|nr:hypothetical protein [Anaerolineae bacterium]
MRAAVARIDIVRKGEHRLVIISRVLNCRFDVIAFNGRAHVKRRVQRFAILVQIAHERSDAAFKIKRRFAVRAFVHEFDGEPFGEERHFAETLLQYVELVINRFENLLVGEKALNRAAAFRRRILADLFHVRLRHAALVRLAVQFALAPHRRFKPFRKGIDRADADAVQTGRDFVPAAAEFAARMKFSHHDFERGLAGLRMNVHRNAAPVIRHRHRVIAVNRDGDEIGAARERFVNRIVHDFVHELMQAANIRRADVHAGAAAHGFEAFEDLDFVGGIIFGWNVFEFEVFLFGHFSSLRTSTN